MTFSDDPLRMMRAIRFSTQLNFRIEEKTFQAIAENKERIQIVSAERISDELSKIMLADKPSIGFKLLEITGLLEIIFPELQRLKGVDIVNNTGHKDNFYHRLKCLTALPLSPTTCKFCRSALLHDIAKRQQKYIEGRG